MKPSTPVETQRTGFPLAEPAAHVADFEVQLVVRHAGVGRELRAHRGVALRAHVQRVTAGVGIVYHGAGARLHRAGRNAAHLHLEARHVRRTGECRFDCRGVTGFGFQRHIAGHVSVQLRCPRRKRGLRLHHGGQVAIRHLNEFGGILRRMERLGHHQRHAFTNVAHLAVRERRALGRAGLHAVLAGELQRVRGIDVARTHGVLPRKNTDYAGMPSRRADIDRHDLRMRPIGAQEVTV
jgi:hypothetical protein